ncbi:MAG: hypothetical protein ACLFV2_11045 [Desulfurivibrionaceae bacterium]
MSDADQYRLGVTGEMEGLVFASGDLIHQGGDAHQAGIDDVSTYLANLTTGAKLSDSAKGSFNFLYGGDDDLDDNDDKSFESIDADVKVGQIFFKDSLAGSLDHYVEDMPHRLAHGLINLALEGEVKLDQRNTIRAAVRYLASAEDMTLSTGGEDDELGYELDLWYSYKMNKNLTFKVEGAYLFSDDLAEDLLADNDDVYQMAAGAVFKF